jgi:hypothetical protein
MAMESEPMNNPGAPALSDGGVDLNSSGNLLVRRWERDPPWLQYHKFRFFLAVRSDSNGLD